MIDWLTSLFDAAQSGLFEQLVQPVLYALGLSVYAEDAFDGTAWFLYGAFEIALLFAILRPLESWRPVEAWNNRRGVRVDVLYTLLDRLGVLPLALFFLLTPAMLSVEGWLRLHGVIPGNLEDWLPWLLGAPLASFLLYLVILDFAEYWRHRLQHRFAAWWALHSLHHSQRKMSFWSDNRNHLLDEVLASLWTAGIALLIGVPPAQFALIVVLGRMLESLAHANLRFSFGGAERLLVSPRFHRVHHAIGLGHEGEHRGCNFAVLFPIWDVLFGTANFGHVYPATGVRDQLDGRDYGSGFWRQQWLGLTRLVEALLPKQFNRRRLSAD